MNKKISALILGLGLGMAALSSNAKAPTDCEELYRWCLDQGQSQSSCACIYQDCMGAAHY